VIARQGSEQHDYGNDFGADDYDKSERRQRFRKSSSHCTQACGALVRHRNECANNPNRGGNDEKQQRYPSEKHAPTKLVSVRDFSVVIHGRKQGSIQFPLWLTLTGVSTSLRFSFAKIGVNAL
jgi:hypothetical protein